MYAIQCPFQEGGTVCACSGPQGDSRSVALGTRSKIHSRRVAPCTPASDVAVRDGPASMCRHGGDTSPVAALRGDD